MEQIQQPAGSASRWGPLFAAHADDWAATWEGPQGWGTPVYEYGTCSTARRSARAPGCLSEGCGAGRFARMAADAGAAVTVAGIDAAEALIDTAANPTPYPAAWWRS